MYPIFECPLHFMLIIVLYMNVLQSVIFMLMYVNVFCSFIFSYILLEMVETERDYVRDLGALVEVGLYSVLLTNTAVKSLWWLHVTEHIHSSNHNWLLLSGFSFV